MRGIGAILSLGGLIGFFLLFWGARDIPISEAPFSLVATTALMLAIYLVGSVWVAAAGITEELKKKDKQGK